MESQIGAKLKTAYPRALQSLAFTQPIAAGVGILQPLVPPAGVPIAPAASLWPLVFGRRYRFRGSAVLYPANPGAVSLESAALIAQLHFPSDPAQNIQIAQAARLAQTTALASGVGISFDDWIVDCADLLNIVGLGTNGPIAGKPDAFALNARIVINNSGGLDQFLMQCVIESTAADYTSYPFEKWESE